MMHVAGFDKIRSSLAKSYHTTAQPRCTTACQPLHISSRLTPVTQVCIQHICNPLLSWCISSLAASTSHVCPSFLLPLFSFLSLLIFYACSLALHWNNCSGATWCLHACWSRSRSRFSSSISVVNAITLFICSDIYASCVLLNQSMLVLIVDFRIWAYTYRSCMLQSTYCKFEKHHGVVDPSRLQALVYLPVCCECPSLSGIAPLKAITQFIHWYCDTHRPG